jgi:hypothetical protein
MRVTGIQTLLLGLRDDRRRQATLHVFWGLPELHRNRKELAEQLLRNGRGENKQIPHSLMARPLVCGKFKAATWNSFKIMISQFIVTNSEHSSKCEDQMQTRYLTFKLSPFWAEQSQQKAAHTFHEPAPTLGLWYLLHLLSSVHTLCRNFFNLELAQRPWF